MSDKILSTQQPIDSGRRSFGAMVLGGAVAAAVAPVSPLAAQRKPMGMGGDWMRMVLAQHREIDQQFMALRRTADRDAVLRDTQLKRLATLLTGHSLAEEVALYPGVALHVSRPESDELYIEQSHAKVMLAELDAMPRRGPEFLPRLGALEAAIKAHVAEEENDLYPRLMRAVTPAMNAKMTADFRREYNRYMA